MRIGARRQRQRQIVGQRGDLADPHAHAPAARLDEIRLHPKLGDGRPAVDLDHLRRRAKGSQRLFDHVRPVQVDLVVVLYILPGVQDLTDRRQRPGARSVAAGVKPGSPVAVGRCGSNGRIAPGSSSGSGGGLKSAGGLRRQALGQPAAQGKISSVPSARGPAGEDRRQPGEQFQHGRSSAIARATTSQPASATAAPPGPSP